LEKAAAEEQIKAARQRLSEKDVARKLPTSNSGIQQS
jgi:hypothetical protein